MTFPAQNPNSSEPGDDEIERRWRELIADLDDIDSNPVLPEASAATPIDEDPESLIEEPVESAQPVHGPRDYDLDDEDITFVPPETGPIASNNPLLTIGWAFALLSFITLLISIFMTAEPVWLSRTAFGTLLASVALLIWQLPRRRRDPDDDGAAV